MSTLPPSMAESRPLISYSVQYIEPSNALQGIKTIVLNELADV